MTGRLTEGSPEPLGLTLDARGANVAVFSRDATAVELCLFDAEGRAETGRMCLPGRTGDVFHGHVEGIRAGQRYGLRAHGPYAPAEGHRYNPSKLLVDPYALALDRPFTFDPAQFGYRPGSADADLTFDTADSALHMPKAIAIDPPPLQPGRAMRPWAETIIYELHVRGFTKAHPHVPEEIRGTFAGLAHPAAIDYLVKLGVTAVEIMPCTAWIDERHLKEAGLTNYWGYNPVVFMAPDPRLAPGGWDEIRHCTSALHAAGIEVILDVVFNHTGEGDGSGPTLSLRGLDDKCYYRLAPDNPRHFINDSGCGNTLALDRPAVLRLVMDSLRTWAGLGGVDGFRFDLATVLGRRDNGFDPEAPLLMAMTQDPMLRNLRLIAEPWDCGPGGYHLGGFPAPWGEWNDRFRDAFRKFWRGDSGLIPPAVTGFAGSSDCFGRRRPSCSVNFIVAHDGFTLADLVSYEHKHNEANGEENRDGTNANYSWNNGAEGPTDDPAIRAARQRDQRNLLASLLLARGTPMLAMGSECGQTQHGNNNAYAQDNPAIWLDWGAADPALLAFTERLIALRKAHPAFTFDRFLTGNAFDAAAIPDVEWLTAKGSAMQGGDWGNGNLHTVIAALYTPASDDRGADRVLCILHAGKEAIEVTLPETRTGFCWHRCLDTAHETGEGGDADFEGGAIIPPRSVAVFEEKPGDERHFARNPGRKASPDLLDRLARAAGIASDWYDIAGERHIVPAETKSALLTDMGLPSERSCEARDSLARLVDEVDLRGLPLTLSAREGEPLKVRLPITGGRVRGGLLVQREDGSQSPIHLGAGDFEFTTFEALDGRRVEAAVATLPEQPLGRHRLVLERQPEIVCHLTVAPKQCYLPPALLGGKKAKGMAAQLYSLRQSGDQGIGDFTALGELAAQVGAAGFVTLGLNPLHALFHSDRERASPYYPSDRRFLDPIYIDVAAAAAMTGGGRAPAALASNAGCIAALSSKPLVDYPGVWTMKRAVLEAAFADFDDMAKQQPDSGPARAFEAFIAGCGPGLFQFACFEAISETRGGEPWTQWPADLAQRNPVALAAFAEANARLVRFHMFLQWLCERQFSDAEARGRESGLTIGFYRDLAVGAAPDGAESWANADQLLRSCRTGAPPDPFAEQGQNWGLQPPNPVAWRRSGYAVFKELIAANMRHAGALRIDHAMAITRLFVIPDGAKAIEGAYLSYPLNDLVAQLALESARARCLVVGEDLGTVPMGFREAMDAADILSYRVFWFERRGEHFAPPSAYPGKSLACLTTHDLPTLAGWWLGEDILEKQALGLILPERAKAALEGRAHDKRALLRLIGREDLADRAGPIDASVVAAMHHLLGQASSLLSIAQIDDVLGELTAVNLPGTDRERPNWRRKLNGSLQALPEKLDVFALLMSAEERRA